MSGNLLGDLFRRLGYLFYVVNPKDTVFETIEEIPNYVNEVIPLFVGFVILEAVVATIKFGKRGFRINDAVGSLSQGIISELFKLLTHGILVSGYVAIHQKWRFVTLPWDSSLTWIIGLLTVDIIYYWLHRASHEVNIFWAAHQVHHSSEDYNLTTALRQSVMQSLTNMLFYFPLALIVPPTVYLVHNQLNLLYQFWIHTELVNKLGPLELVLNTPSHHRVHHGRNRYCIDANYAGMLIIWDRMFGTFQPEAEEVVYGLTHPLNTFSPMQTQLGHYLHIWKTFLSTPGLGNKLSVIFKGPGWSPGKPRLGDPLEIPDAHAPAIKYDPEISVWMQAYSALHFSLILFGYLELTFKYSEGAFQISLLAGIAVLLFSLTSLGAILDKRWYAPIMELFRCLILMSVESLIHMFHEQELEQSEAPHKTVIMSIRICFGLSAVLWTGIAFRNISPLTINMKKAN